MNRAAVKPAPAPENRVLPPIADQPLTETKQIPVNVVPVKPGNFAVLAIGIVVAALASAAFVAAQEHGHPLGKKQGDQKVSFLPGAQAHHSRIAGRPFRTAVPRTVVTFAVAVFLAVGLVVLFIVGNQIVQSKTVMGGDEVDAGEGQPGGLFIKVRTAGDAGCELTQGLLLPAPEITDAVAVFAVPFGPYRRKVADLVAALAHVPGLGDELDLADDGVLLNDVEKNAERRSTSCSSRARVEARSKRNPSTCISRIQ